MRTIRIKAYKFDELSDEAKEVAISNYRNKGYDQSFYYDEINSSAKAVIELFGLKAGNTYADLETGYIDDCILELSGARLYTYIVNNYTNRFIKPNFISKHKDGTFKNSDFQYKYDCVKFKRSNVFYTDNLDNCPLTGVCYDNDILQPIEDFLKKPDKNTTFAELIKDIENAISKCYDNTEEWLYSEEFISEDMVANDWEFTIDGKNI